jgi:hypothetical protein
VPFRLLRTTVFAVVCLGLGWGAHVFAGGTVSGGAMAGGLAAAFAVAYPLSARERTLGVILPLLGGLQVGMHLAFSLAHAASPAQLMAHVHSGLVPALGMMAAHAWATVLTALWLARGEALFWALLRRLAVRLLVLRLPSFWTPFLAPCWTAEPPVLRSAVLRYAVSRRGPPALVEFR